MLRFFKQYYPIRNIFFVIGEGFFIYISVLAATWMLFNPESFAFNNLFSRKASLIAFVCMICLYFNDVYDLQITNSYFELGIRLFQALGASSIILACVYFLFQEMIIGKGIFFITIIFSMMLIIIWRFFYKFILTTSIFDQKIIILGSGGVGEQIVNETIKRRDCGYKVSSVIMESHNGSLLSYHGTPVIYKKKFEGLCQTAKEMGIKKIVLDLKEKRGAFPTKELLNCRIGGIDILEGNSFYEMLTGKLIVNQINPGWLIFSDGFKKSFIKRFMKRFIDILFSFILLVILLPVILATAILIKIDSRGPVFFSQSRVGQKRKIYKVFKFRSMIVDAEKRSGPVWAKSNDDRITRIGKFIRKCRIDEIPQLWNVLKGDMSFAGPRPERYYFVNKLEEVIPYYSQRFSVKPGVTGWAQVSYGYGATVEDAIEKLNYDLYYIKNMSIFMDLIIVMRTVKTVLFGKGSR
ncbi:MAG: TIGR03013 family PEP-CTERM/XrtA system glycosyltransferase [Deltaproteobacteria bacterium]|nr:TIGR03013 family PEP-CTERM/XrtA system glycosyltransferase [Deltaproteobacteria bacterium]